MCGILRIIKRMDFAGGIRMNVNIYYGGRGLIEDPTVYVIGKLQEVLDELRVHVTRYDLHEQKSKMTTLPQTIKEADAVILAASVEWHGIGGYMNEFLDACWLYGDKEVISKIYMCPVVVSTTYGEKEAMTDLKNAWELLGGKVCNEICTYVSESVDFEMNKEYASIIEKRAEDLYRIVSQKRTVLPTSSYAIRQNIMKESLELTPQETEQLSKYASDDYYVKQQKEDIEELKMLFKGMIDSDDKSEDEYISNFKKAFNRKNAERATYTFILEDINKSLFVSVDETEIICSYEKMTDVDVMIRLTTQVLSNIMSGRYTFQRAFMTGVITTKGDFAALRKLDVIFDFGNY